MIDITKFEGHTPGPWMDTAFGRITSSANLPVADVCGWLWRTGSRPAQEANAALLAAAPDLLAEVVRLRAEAAAMAEQRDCALSMLAGWCVDVDRNGTGWDGWDENYKDAMYRPGPLRKELDAAIAAENASRGGAA